ncbi:Scr1 family TA system antitoxin-like transcriptional regulator [Amycolatopsis rhabdoformis]|uniref:Scr1 family TA system antitoxin-like transcriptional regulator n=1 Tax=Amycolatopsis rhabdoformis TaxID=1448059 RepID=A0ABZ1IML1_9PSEU|nr:Scr1 family TA system antitoxin-like transcriptional regulator [Amycolatopsis rhabdoformis]WSE34968.1 Scr1 family TA system antitoxin-like transcriptional regulator [Amycolatopsis rhabdoformis]
MTKPSGPPRAVALGAALREVREARKFGLRELARALDLNPSLVAHWEAGTRIPTGEDVAMLLGYLRVIGEPKSRIMDLTRHVRDPNWMAAGQAELTPELTTLLQYEQGARAINEWALNVIPGLLQTPDYARNIFEDSGLTAEQTDARIQVRLNRQKILAERDPVSYSAIIGIHAIDEPVAADWVMSDQMDHLLAMSERPNVALRVLPRQPHYHPGMNGSFIIFEYQHRDPVVLLEQHSTTSFLSAGKDWGLYRQLARLLAGEALSEDASRAVIAEAAK